MNLFEIKSAIKDLQKKSKLNFSSQVIKDELDKAKEALMSHFRQAKSLEERKEVIALTGEIMDLVREDMGQMAEKEGVPDHVLIEKLHDPKSYDSSGWETLHGLEPQSTEETGSSSYKPVKKLKRRRSFNSQNWAAV